MRSVGTFAGGAGAAAPGTVGRAGGPIRIVGAEGRDCERGAPPTSIVRETMTGGDAGGGGAGFAGAAA